MLAILWMTFVGLHHLVFFRSVCFVNVVLSLIISLLTSRGIYKGNKTHLGCFFFILLYYCFLSADQRNNKQDPRCNGPAARFVRIGAANARHAPMTCDVVLTVLGSRVFGDATTNTVAVFASTLNAAMFLFMTTKTSSSSLPSIVVYFVALIRFDFDLDSTKQLDFYFDKQSIKTESESSNEQTSHERVQITRFRIRAISGRFGVKSLFIGYYSV